MRNEYVTKNIKFNFHLNTVQLDYNVMKETEYFVSLQECCLQE
jgi:hypothetical protein